MSSQKTAIVTGGAGGIGAQTIRTYASQGFNVVIADLPASQPAAESLIASLPDPEKGLYHPVLPILPLYPDPRVLILMRLLDEYCVVDRHAISIPKYEGEIR